MLFSKKNLEGSSSLISRIKLISAYGGRLSAYRGRPSAYGVGLRPTGGRPSAYSQMSEVLIIDAVISMTYNWSHVDVY